MPDDATDNPPVSEALQLDREGLDTLMPLVYDELRKVAHGKMRSERGSHTLNPTAVVHETYMRLRRLRRIPWETRRQFFMLASGVMRNFLVDYARARNADKRPYGRQQVTLEVADLSHAYQQSFDVLIIHEALEKLRARDPELVRLIDLRFFCGLTQEETAEVLGVSRSQVQEQWAIAKGFLAHFITGNDGPAR